jgi:uncharacterized phiE125 gp8 family phage protein
MARAGAPERKTMSAQRLSEPAIEPVSLDEFRDWLRVEPGREETILAHLLVAARLALEGHTRRGFVSQDWRFTYACSLSGGLMRLPLGPLRAVVALRVYDAAGAATSLAPAAYELVRDDQRPAVRLLDLDARARAARVELDVTIGYGPAAGDVPAPLRQAILMLATNWHARRGDHSETGLTLPRAITTLVAPWRRARLA